MLEFDIDKDMSKYKESFIFRGMVTDRIIKYYNKLIAITIDIDNGRYLTFLDDEKRESYWNKMIGKKVCFVSSPHDWIIKEEQWEFEH